MAVQDDDPLLKLSEDECISPLDDVDPRLVVRQFCSTCCQAGCIHFTGTSAASQFQPPYQPLAQDDDGVDDGVPRHCHSSSVQRMETDRNTESRQALSRLICVAVLCFLFMVAEWVGGFMANSLAIMSDAAHLLSDFGSFIISIVAIWLSLSPATRKMTFGFHRAEVLGAGISVLIIWLVTGVLVYLAVDRVVHGHFEIEADTMLIVAGLGVAINILMGAVLHGSCAVPGHVHSHSHLGHSSAHGSSNGRSGQHGVQQPPPPHHAGRNINIRAALIHVLGDLIQSIGVLTAAIIIKFKPEYRVADPICTFIFSAIVLFTTVGVIRDVVRILMEAAPSSVVYSDVVADLESVAGVVRVHGVNIWSLNMDRLACSAHLVKDAQVDGDLVLKTALSVLRLRHDIHIATIQVESYQPLMEQCSQCQLLTV